MSTTIAPSMTSTDAAHLHLRNARPSFFGLVRGELFKISRQWTTWIMAVLLVGIMALPYLVTLTVPDIQNSINHTPLQFLTVRVESNLAVLRAFAGIYLLIVTAYVIGQEYQFGTIRILLARGVARLQLLAAKLLAIVIVALILLVGGLLLDALFTCSLLLILTGNLNALNALNGAFWSDTWLYLLTILVSMGVTILMATAISVVGRSLAFGMSLSLGWFAADNIGVLMMIFANRLTHNDFWLNVTGYLLGPNLNQMPVSLIGGKTFSIGITPFVNVDGTHTLLVALVYSLIFAGVAIVLMWRRDVKE